MDGRIYIVTGAAGHLGSVITRMLARRGETVRALALPGDECLALRGLDIELVRGDVCDTVALEPLFENTKGRPLTVIHAAGIVAITSRPEQVVYDVNVGGTKNIIALCLRYNVEKLVYVSSVHAIPESGGAIRETSHFAPELVHGFYAQTKAIATRAVLDAVSAGLDASVVHPSGIIGPGDWGHAHLTQLILDYLNGRLRACVRGGYDFVDVRDVAAGTIACAQLGKPGECYILSGHYCTIAELLDQLHVISGHKKISLVLPMGFAKLTAPLAECYYGLLRRPPLYTAYSLYTVETNADFSHKKAAEQLGYRPRPLSVTLADTCEWLQRMGRITRQA